MLTKGQNVYYLDAKGIIHQCNVEEVIEAEVRLKCKNGSFETATSVHDAHIFEHAVEAERYLQI